MFLRDHKKTAITLPEGSISYSQLLQSAHGFASLFPRKMQRVLILSENRPEWMYAAYAAWVNSATVVPVDYLSTVDEVLYIARDCTPAVIFCSQQTKSVLEQVIARLEYSPQLLVFEELPASGQSAPEPVEIVDEQATALIIYTSGTTGSPKGVMLSFANILANIEAVTSGVPIYNREERVLILLPLHHIFPLLGTMVAPLFVGSTTVLCPTLESSAILQTLQQNAVTIIIGVPRLYKVMITGIMAKIQASAPARQLLKIAEKAKSPTLSRLLFKKVHEKFGGHIKYLVSGGAALDPEVGNHFTTLGFTVLEGYGMTETAPMISFTRPDNVTIGSAGTAMTCTRIEIRNGEIVVSGDNVMQGYWQRPEETAEVLKDGWMYTGDLGHLDEQGRLFITGRRKEILILPNGKNINPVLHETQLERSTEFISEVAVFLHKDILQAIIKPDLPRLRNNGITDIEEYFRYKVIEPFNLSVSPAKRIKKITLVTEDLPKTRLSKLKRFELPAMVEQAQIHKNQAEQPVYEEYRIIKEFIQVQTAQDIHPDDHLEIDIALDSLDKVSLLTFISSTFGIDIGEEKLMTHQTVRKLSCFVREKKKKITVELVNWKDILKEKIELNLPGTWFTAPLIKNLTKALFSVYFRYSGEGKENLPDSPCIIAPNHQSFFDGLFVAALLKDASVKKTYFYAKEKHLRNKWVRSFAHHNNIIVMDINNDLKESIQKLAALLRNGKNIIVFPEGTRSIDGAVGEFKRMFAILSKELNVPVVPVTINGAYEALPAGTFFPKPFKKISVNFQKPIFPEDHTYESLRQQVVQKVCEKLKQ